MGAEEFLFEDTRYFGRLTLDTGAVANLGPEPLGPAFTALHLRLGLARSAQPVKVKLLDQGLVAGIGNICASEALFRAGISPLVRSRDLREEQIAELRRAIRQVLSEAIARGSTVPPELPGASVDRAEAPSGGSEWLRGVRPGGPTLSPLPRPDRAAGAGGAEHVLLSRLPGRGELKEARRRRSPVPPGTEPPDGDRSGEPPGG